MPRKKKEVEVIDMDGAKTVKKKASVVSWTKRIFAIVSVIWLALVFIAPLWVKNTYSQPIKNQSLYQCSLICNAILLNSMKNCWMG